MNEQSVVHRQQPGAGQEDPAGPSPIQQSRAVRTARRLSAIPTPVIFGFSIVLAMLLLLWEGALGDVGPAIRRADAGTIVAGLLLYLAGLALLCLRWHLLVRMIKGVSHAPRAAEAFLTSVVINYAAPVSLAVPSRVALTKRALGLTATETGAVALWEIATDVLVLGLASLLWFGVGGREADTFSAASSSALVVVGIILGALLAGIALLFIVARTRPRLWERILATVRTTLTYPTRRPLDAVLAVGTTVVYWIVQGAVFWLLLDAIGEDPSLALVLGLISLPILVGMLSPVPGGAGVREALMLAVARVHGADGASVLLAAVTYRVALFASIPILYALVRVWLTFDPAPQPAPVSEAE
ncbi:MAG TPA: lysylphosphatidylglycerol synthase transmembrane domain-containing protein [Thermomicrobiales bacterium]